MSNGVGDLNSSNEDHTEGKSEGKAVCIVSPLNNTGDGAVSRRSGLTAPSRATGLCVSLENQWTRVQLRLTELYQ